MKVLLRIRSDVTAFPGGDYIQLLKTKRALEQLGVECVVAPGLTPIPPGIDVVHLFNTTRIHETFLQFREARGRGIPVVLTPIWHSMREMRRFYGSLYGLPFFPIWSYCGVKEWYYARRSRLRPLWSASWSFRRLAREVVRGADAVLPHSQAELEILERELGVRPRAAFVVLPAFDHMPAGPAPAGERRDLLCVGRIEPRKNQLSIIHAFKALGRSEHRLLLFGSVNESHPGYFEKVRAQLEPGWVEYRGQVPLEEVYSAYAQSKAVILASFFETCGFAAMEAMSCGAHACVTDSPYTRAFYADRVAYCDPFSTRSMQRGIERVLRQPAADYAELLSDYSWDRAAGATRDVYQHVAGANGPAAAEGLSDVFAR